MSAGIILATLLSACGKAPSDFDALARKVDTVPYSRFDDAGKDHIYDSRILRMDLRSLPISGSSLGIARDRWPALSFGPGLLLAFDGPSGRSTSRAVTVSITTDTDGVVNWVHANRSLPADELIAELRRGVEDWGLPRDDVEALIADLHRHLAPGCPEVVPKLIADCSLGSDTTGVAPSGIVAHVEVRHDGDDLIQISYKLPLSPAYYTPSALTTIRTTGRLPRLTPAGE